MADEQDEMNDVLRRQNRVLRATNRVLRRRLTRIEEHADSIFIALCDGPAVLEEGLAEFLDQD